MAPVAVHFSACVAIIIMLTIICVCCICYRLDDVAGQFNVDLVAAITDAVCPTLDSPSPPDTALQCYGQLLPLV